MHISTSNLVEIIDVKVYVCGILSKSVGQQTGSRNMANIKHIKFKNQRKTSPNRQNFPLYQEIGVGESNGGVKIYAGSS